MNSKIVGFSSSEKSLSAYDLIYIWPLLHCMVIFLIYYANTKQGVHYLSLKLDKTIQNLFRLQTFS